MKSVPRLGAAYPFAWSDRLDDADDRPEIPPDYIFPGIFGAVAALERRITQAVPPGIVLKDREYHNEQIPPNHRAYQVALFRFIRQLCSPLSLSLLQFLFQKATYYESRRDEFLLAYGSFFRPDKLKRVSYEFPRLSQSAIVDIFDIQQSPSSIANRLEDRSGDCRACLAQQAPASVSTHRRNISKRYRGNTSGVA